MIRKGPRGYYADCNGVQGCEEETKPSRTRKGAESGVARAGWLLRAGVTWCPACLDAVAADVDCKLKLGNPGLTEAH